MRACAVSGLKFSQFLTIYAKFKMKLPLLGFLLVLLSLGQAWETGEKSDKYEEVLRIKSLPSGHLYAYFEFTIVEKELSNFSRLFPRSLIEVLEAHSVRELHFSLTQGHWRTESWGQGMVAAPSGAQVRAWFTAPNNE